MEESSKNVKIYITVAPEGDKSWLEWKGRAGNIGINNDREWKICKTSNLKNSKRPELTESTRKKLTTKFIMVKFEHIKVKESIIKGLLMRKTNHLHRNKNQTDIRLLKNNSAQYKTVMGDGFKVLVENNIYWSYYFISS